MLARILKEFRKSGGAVSLDELSRRLGMERSALDGMLMTLVRQGRIREADGSGTVCAGCGQNTKCPYAKMGSKTSRLFQLN